MDKDSILLALLKNPHVVENNRSTFQWIVDTAGVGNRNTCRKILNELRNQKLIVEEPMKNYKNGQKKWFILTKKGKTKAQQFLLDKINQCLSSLEVITGSLNPAEVRADIDSKYDILWEFMVNNQNSFKRKQFTEKVEEFTRKQAEMAKPLHQSLYRLHKILTHLRRGEVDYSQYVTVVKGDGNDPLTIPLRFLEGIDFVSLFFLAYSTNLQDLKIRWNAKPSNSKV
jgi:predicted transcriptional regulator